MKIVISEDKLVELVKNAYDLSVPQGLGLIHFTPEPISDEEARAMINPSERIAVHMDYVAGRACKMTVFHEDGEYFIHSPWYDHTDDQLVSLLQRIDVEVPTELLGEEHGISCNCLGCQHKSLD